MKDHIKRALVAKRESKYIDFKGALDFSEPHAWCEIVKDIVAMANSGGGVLLIGLNNTGDPTGFDPQPVLDMDAAVVTDRIEKYTGVQFDGFSVSEETKKGNRLAAILVEGVSVPIVFTKPGTYAISDLQTGNRNKRDDIDRAHSGVFALMFVHVDFVFGSSEKRLKRFDHAFRIPEKGNDRPIIILVGFDANHFESVVVL